jgi:AcrR family transcriptional regulator
MDAAVEKRSRGRAGRRPKARGVDRDTRAAIVSAARHVFARHGFDGTSMRQIAEKARVNQAMIYYYFKDKVDVYRSVLSDSFAELRKIWDNEVFVSDAPTTAKLRAYIEGFIRFQNANEDLRRIFLHDFTVFGTHVKWTVDRYFADSYGRLFTILKDGMRRGELKKVDPPLAITSLIGMISHSFMFRPLAEYVSGKRLDLSPSRFGAFVANLYLEGLVKKGSAGHGKA